MLKGLHAHDVVTATKILLRESRPNRLQFQTRFDVLHEFLPNMKLEAGRVRNYDEAESGGFRHHTFQMHA